MRMPDMLKKFIRGPQIIMPKDVAIITSFTGLSPGDTVVDAGTGSGFLALQMANLVRPTGKVTTYERRKEFAKLASRNMKKSRLSKYIEIKNKDIYDGIDEKRVDVITLDLPEPWEAVRHAKGALKKGGFLVSYSPSIEQVRKFVTTCTDKKLIHEKTVECSLREMVLRERGTRPQIKGIMHTGYITFIRK